MTIIPHFPQYVLLVYMPKDKIIREYIKIKPKGMFFHEAYHPNVNYLIAWFKRHFAERTYQGQLARTKPPTMDTTVHFAVPGKAKPFT